MIGARLELCLSLGKSVAQITAEFAPIAGLSILTELLCGIVELCENVSHNKNAAHQLRDRAHGLLILVADGKKVSSSNPMMEALQGAEDCLMDIRTRMHGWGMLSKLEGFTRQKEIQHDMSLCHAKISDCMTKLQMESHVLIHNWQDEFQRNCRMDHLEIVGYLSEIQNSQDLTNQALAVHGDQLRQMMGMMQRLMFETKVIGDRVHNGLSSNLYSIQMQSGELLPNFNLDSGEITRIGQFPVSGTSAMDIFEGLYLQREKVAIKVVRAVNSSESSLRRFNREAKIWAEIYQKDRGEHILPFYGFCQHDGPYPYMVSPWQANGNALAYVKKYDTGVDHRRLVRGIALGVQVLHSMSPPVVHGDLKATNIVINARGDPLIADFGLSRIIEDITGIPFTQSRGVSESYRWFAPEVCVGEGVLSLSSDIYAFAMTVLELMTHNQPYAKIKHTTEVVIRSSNGEYPDKPVDPAVIARGLDDKLWVLLKRCWSKRSTHRPHIGEIVAVI